MDLDKAHTWVRRCYPNMIVDRGIEAYGYAEIKAAVGQRAVVVDVNGRITAAEALSEGGLHYNPKYVGKPVFVFTLTPKIKVNTMSRKLRTVVLSDLSPGDTCYFDEGGEHPWTLIGESGGAGIKGGHKIKPENGPAISVRNPRVFVPAPAILGDMRKGDVFVFIDNPKVTWTMIDVYSDGRRLIEMEGCPWRFPINTGTAPMIATVKKVG